MKSSSRAYTWVPSLYFAEALPYMAVIFMSTTLYTRMGLSNTELAFYTSWLYLPWVIKPLWSPFVDAIKTKRWWVIAMQTLLGAGFAGIAFTLNTSFWLSASLAFFWLIAFSSATHDIAADGFYILALDSHEQSLYVGIRSTFYRIGNIFVQGAMVILAGFLEKHLVSNNLPNIPAAWAITFGTLAAIILLLAVYHHFRLPHVEAQPETVAETEQGNMLWQVLRQFGQTVKTFFTKPQIIPALLFMLLFRFPEAQLGKITTPFLLDTYEHGGLALSTASVGTIYGVVGVVGLLLGGILGGILVAKDGLKRWLWPMVAAISIPDAVYILLSATQTSNLWLINSCVFLEQFGYGFGFTAYMLYLIYFSRGESSTSVYALCTAFMALGMMLPGMMAGWLADTLGYTNFFIAVLVFTAITFLVTAFLRIDPDFGKKGHE